MSVPKQTIGLTNFVGSISKCSSSLNPDAIRSIVFSKCDNLSVVNGAATEIQISLTNFFVPVTDAARLSFTLPASGDTTAPYTIQKMDLAGIDTSETVKFLSLFPQYGSGTASNSSYIEWAFIDAIEDGELLVSDPIGLTGDSNFGISTINKLKFSWGGYIDYANGGTGSLYAATNGGLLKWDGENCKLWNTLNSTISTDFLNSIDVDAYNNVWVASNKGVLGFNELSQPNFNVKFDAAGSGIPSDIVNDIKLFSTDQIVIATSKGLSIFDNLGATISNYTIYNSPLLKHGNLNRVEVSSDTLIFAGTTGGVYIMNPSTKLWNPKPLNSSTVTGWTGPDNVQALASYNGNLYVGTTGGLIIIPYAGTTGTTVPFPGVTASVVTGGTGATAPFSSDFYSLRIEKYASYYYLYAGHGTSGVSRLDIANNTWWSNSLTGSTGSITDVIPDFTSGTTSSQTIYCGTTGYGILKTLTSDYSESFVPDLSTTNVNLLVSIPSSESNIGNYMLDSSMLYSTLQPVYLVFSKDMTAGGATSGASIESFITLKAGIEGTGATVAGSWLWDSTGKIAKFTPTVALSTAEAYNLKIAIGGTSDNDSSYLTTGLDVGFYTENVTPILGWNTIGKMFVLSGSDVKYTKGIYLRNTQTTDINIISLIGK